MWNLRFSIQILYIVCTSVATQHARCHKEYYSSRGQAVSTSHFGVREQRPFCVSKAILHFWMSSTPQKSHCFGKCRHLRRATGATTQAMINLKTSNAPFSRSTWRNFMKLCLITAKFYALLHWDPPRILKHCLTHEITKPWSYPKIILLWRPCRSLNSFQTNFLAHREVKAGSTYDCSSPLNPNIEFSQVGSLLKLRFSMPKVHLCPSLLQRELPLKYYLQFPFPASHFPKKLT